VRQPEIFAEKIISGRAPKWTHEFRDFGRSKYMEVTK
jgi:hypothetical protein